MPEEWRCNVLIPIFKNKRDVHSCSNYRGITLISHTIKLWERVVERRLRSDLTFSEQQYGFMPGRSTTDALLAVSVLMEKYRECQNELQCMFVDLPTLRLLDGVSLFLISPKSPFAEIEISVF